jgi:hypothetical protein
VRSWLVLLALVLAPRPLAAGYRPLEVLFVNMTPDSESSAASRRCVRAIESRIKADDTHFFRSGETALRKQVGKTAGEPFLDWTASVFEPARVRGDVGVDAVVLVDCRPEKRTLDVLVNAAPGALVRLSVRRVAIDTGVTDFVGGAILRRAWAGFQV